MSEKFIEITDPNFDRYATLNLISWWDQERLRQAKVMVIGVGALGNEVLKNLALLGVGWILIVDFDVIEISNLSRSILFRKEDAGRRKVEVAAERITEINPDVQVTIFHGDVTRDLGLGIYRQVDVVLGCVDNRAARLAINRACWRIGTPWIDGGLDVLMGMVRIFVPPEGACYECTMSEQDYRLINLRHSCGNIVQGRIPTTPTDASIIGAFQVQEAIKLLHGLEVPTGNGIYFNGQNYRSGLISYRRRGDCFSHETYDQIIELDVGVDDLSVGSFIELLTEYVGGKVILLLDHDIVGTFYCPSCKKIEDIYQPFDSVMPTQVKCPLCQSNRIPDITTRLIQNAITAEIPLKQIGIPPLHIVRAESSNQRFYVELKKDTNSALKLWQD